MAYDASAGPRLSPGAAGTARWITLTEGRTGGVEQHAVTPARVLLQVGIAALLVIAVVTAGSLVVARRTAEREAVNGAAQSTSLLANVVVQPALEDALLSQSPETARAALDRVVRDRVLTTSVVRVKLWTSQGRIVYSDEPRLIGRTYPLGDDEREALTEPATRAEVTDLHRPENQYERGRGKLLEVYRPVWTPGGKPLLFETYTPYTTVSQRTELLWRGFAGIVVSSLLLLIVLLAPLLWTLLGRLRHGQRQREELLQHAVDASTEERRRIAGTLHDGVVQELAAASFAVSASADQAEARQQRQLAEQLRSAAETVRASIGGLRSLLVDIYPPTLRTAGLVTALSDLATPLRSRDIDVRLVLPDAPGPVDLPVEKAQLVFRVAQECLRNVVRHAAAHVVEVRLFAEDGLVVLEVADDGLGFDVDAVRRAPEEGHLGLRLLPDLAAQAGATLRVASALRAGTRWRLEVPRG